MSTRLLVTQASAGQQPPPPPAAPPAPSPDVVVGVPAPLARMDLPALRARRDELSRQITSASDRRDEAAEQLKNSPPSLRPGIEGRIKVLDARIMQLESDIAANGQAMAAAQVAGRTSTETAPAPRYGPFTSGQLTAISILSIIMVWAPLAFATARIMMKRWAHPKPAPQILESSARLERMEQAVEAVAIEIERISEGQRFVTQLMAKREATSPSPLLASSPDSR